MSVIYFIYGRPQSRFVVNPSIVYTVESQKSVRPITTALGFKGDAANSSNIPPDLGTRQTCLVKI